MVSALELHEDIANEFKNLSFKRKHRYMICKLSDDQKSAIVEKIGARDSTFEDFQNDMPKDEPRWAVYEIEWTSDDQRKEAKVIFINYSPDNAKVPKDRFAYSQFKSAVRAKIDPIHKELQVNDHADINWNAFREEF